LAAVRQSNDWHYVFPYTVVTPTKGHMRDGKEIQKGDVLVLHSTLRRRPDT